MSQNAKAARLAASYGELKKLIESSSFSRIIKTSNKIINEDAKEVEAWKCKIVALIQTDQFKEASQTIHKAPNKNDFQFELAYCKYRQNDVIGALEVLKSDPNKDSARSRELLAQIYYRLEQYEDCHGLYKELLRSTDDDYDMERSTNMGAVQAQRTLLKQCPLADAPKAKNSSYEQWYNSGCAALFAENYDEAAIRLGKSLQKCNELLKEEDASEEDMQQEPAIIRVQQAYVLQMQGKTKEALAIYNSVQDIKPTDPVLVALLHNNTSAISQNQLGGFDVRKKLKSMQISDLMNKLTAAQNDQLSLNNCITVYLAQQSQQEDKNLIQECTKLIESTTTQPSMKRNALLTLCASLAKAGKIDDAVTKLMKWAKANPDDAVSATLAVVQLRLMKSDIPSAIDALSSLAPSIKFKPGIVGALVTLLTNRKQKDKVTKLLDDAVKFHSKNKDSDTEALEKLLRRASDLQMRDGCPQAAAMALEQLRISSPQANDACVASLINCYSQFDKKKAMELSRTLPDFNTDGLDLDALEASLGPKYFQKATHKDVSAKPDAASGRTTTRKKKKRKTVLPKSYVEGVVPDPDRWLPRWQRKTGAKRRKDRRKDKDVGKGTQGGASDAADKYDITKNAKQHQSSSHSQHQGKGSHAPKRHMPKKRTNKKK